MKRIVLVLLLVCAPVFAQTKHTPSPFEVSKTPPPFCDIRLVSVGMVNGSPAYVRLAFIADALASAQSASETMKKEIADIKASTSLTEFLEVQSQAMNEASGYLHCAAQIVFRYKTVDKDDANLRLLLIAAFNQEAQSVIDLTANEKRRMMRVNPVSSDSRIASKDAEEVAKILETQRDAASTLLEGITMAIIEATAPSPDGLTTSGLYMNCSERTDLLGRVEPTSTGTETAYSQDAGIIKDAISKHNCIEAPAKP